MTLPTIAGVQSRIHTLPDHPPFMIIREMAEVFGMEARLITRQFQKNRHEFPEGYYFVLTPEEYRTQSALLVQTAERSRTDLEQFGFTEKGALLLLRFMTGEQAVRATIALIDAFTGLRDGQMERLRVAAFKDKAGYIGKSVMRQAILQAALDGWSFAQLWDAYTWSRPVLGRAIEDMRVRGYIPQHALFVPAFVFDKRRYEMELMELHAEDDRQMRLGLEG